jgi:hypothetical protein
MKRTREKNKGGNTNIQQTKWYKRVRNAEKKYNYKEIEKRRNKKQVAKQK